LPVISDYSIQQKTTTTLFFSVVSTGQIDVWVYLWGPTFLNFDWPLLVCWWWYGRKLLLLTRNWFGFFG
jgi:hypothetical protein